MRLALLPLTAALALLGAGASGAVVARAIAEPQLALRDGSGAGYTDPAADGGSSLGLFPNNTNGEPLNVIVSADSDAYIHSLDGFTAWSNAMGFGKECFGLHSGAAMQANLGDGQGLRDQQAEFRDLLDLPPFIGACSESLVGGNHFRFWQQSTTGAWFLAVSEEQNVFEHHDIVPDGYDKGRDDLVARAQKGPSRLGKTYAASVQYVTGLLPTGADGINHGIAIDGRTAVLTISVSAS